MAIESFANSFIVPTPCRFSLANIRGSINIQPGEEGVIQVTAVKHLDSGDAQNTEIEMTQAEDGSVAVGTHYAEGFRWLFFAGRPCKVDYSVRLPGSCTVKVSGVSSRASIRGISGEIKLSTVSGPLSLAELYGPLEVKSVSGEVRGENLSGLLRLETVSGSVYLEASRFSSLRASTVSGDLSIETDLSAGPYGFHSVSGEVRLIVPPETGCAVVSRSVSGGVRTELPVTSSWRNAGLSRVEVQGGGPEVRHNSISGDIKLLLAKTRPDSPMVESEAVPISPAPERQREVLALIANGKLSAEEGLKSLRLHR